MRRRILITVILTIAALLGAGVGVTQARFTDAPMLGANDFTSATLHPPTGLGATAGCQLLAPRITLTWTATTSTFASGYDIYRSTTNGGPYSLLTHLDGPSTTTYVDTGSLSLNTWYYYVLRSAAHSWTSVSSSQAGANTPGLCLL
jgi:hypothetical protein